MTRPHLGSPVVECLPCVWKVVGSDPSWVILKTSKIRHGAALLSTQHYKVRQRKYGWIIHFGLQTPTEQGAISGACNVAFQ